jgi:hypothetical protein
VSDLWVPLDVNYWKGDLLDAGPLAELLYVRGLSFCKEHLTDGLIRRSQLVLVAVGIPDPTEQARALVSIGAWVEHSEGWLVPAFLDRNRTKAAVEAEKQQKREAGGLGNHERWHVREGRVDPACPHCVPDQSQVRSQIDRTPIAQASPEAEAETEPQTEPTSTSTSGDDKRRRPTAPQEHARRAPEAKSTEAWRPFTSTLLRNALSRRGIDFEEDDAVSAAKHVLEPHATKHGINLDTAAIEAIASGTYEALTRSEHPRTNVGNAEVEAVCQFFTKAGAELTEDSYWAMVNEGVGHIVHIESRGRDVYGVDGTIDTDAVAEARAQPVEPRRRVEPPPPSGERRHAETRLRAKSLEWRCSSCKTAPGHSCVTPQGVKTQTHVVRLLPLINQVACERQYETPGWMTHCGAPVGVSCDLSKTGKGCRHEGRWRARVTAEIDGLALPPPVVITNPPRHVTEHLADEADDDWRAADERF